MRFCLYHGAVLQSITLIIVFDEEAGPSGRAV
jgi:hypothetical protein